MNVTLSCHAITQDEFLSWVEKQEGRYEFGDTKPVNMTADINDHGIIAGNVYFALQRQVGRDHAAR